MHSEHSFLVGDDGSDSEERSHVPNNLVLNICFKWKFPLWPSTPEEFLPFASELEKEPVALPTKECLQDWFKWRFKPHIKVHFGNYILFCPNSLIRHLVMNWFPWWLLILHKRGETRQCSPWGHPHSQLGSAHLDTWQLDIITQLCFDSKHKL